MDKIEKFLLKLSIKEREVILGLLEKILTNKRKSEDYVKIQGQKNTYRIRKGQVRIVFYTDGAIISVINIDYRGNVYKRL